MTTGVFRGDYCTQITRANLTRIWCKESRGSRAYSRDRLHFPHTHQSLGVLLVVLRRSRCSCRSSCCSICSRVGGAGGDERDGRDGGQRGGEGRARTRRRLLRVLRQLQTARCCCKGMLTADKTRHEMTLPISRTLSPLWPIRQCAK